MNRAAKGTVIGPREVTVEAVKVREYYEALDVRPSAPVTLGAPAPLGFPIDDLELIWSALEIEHRASLHAGQSITAHRQLRIGETLSATTSILDIWDKGTLCFATLSTTYVDQDGREILVSEMTVVERQDLVTGASQ